MRAKEDGSLAAIERAAAIVDEGSETPWDAPSRFGSMGLWARSALLRVLRPYAVRQREIDHALMRAISAGQAQRQPARETGPVAVELAAALPENVVDIETALGSLLLDEADTLITPLIVEHQVWETDVVAFIRSRLESGMTFVDVGAHAGYFSLLASGIVGEDGQVFAVEPQPRNLELLRANLWRHRCDNVTVLPVAAHAERGHVPLVSNPDGLAGSWIEAEHEKATMVPCAPLDELLGGLRVDLVKMDIERSEPEAIRGAEGLIQAAPSLDIVAEFWPTHPYSGGQSSADVLAFYESLGLELRLLNPDGSTAPATAEQVLAKGEVSPIMNIVLHKR